MIKANDPLIVGSALLFLSFLLLFAGLYNYVRQKRSRSRVINKIRLEGTAQELASAGALLPGAEAGESRLSRMLGAVGDRLKPGDTEDLKRRTMDFLRAGIRRPNALAVFWGVKCLLALGFAGVFLGLRPILFPLLLPTNVLAVSVFLIAAGFYLPDLWLRNRISRRRRSIQDGLPDALDLLVICVEAGIGLDAAIHRVAGEMRLENRELSDELTLMTLEVRAGKLRRDALKSLAMRTDLDDVRSLVTLLIQTDKFGTSVAQALRVYSDAFRTTRMQRAEQIAAKLPVKMLIPMVLFIFPCIFVVLLGPAVIQIYRILIQK